MSNTSLRPGDTAPYNMIKGPNGLRAGWRLLIFFAILLTLGYAANRIVDSVMEKLHADFFTPLGGTIVLGGLASTLILAAWIMGRIEGRSLADYGLPWRRAFCLQFWQGSSIQLRAPHCSAYCVAPFVSFIVRVAGYSFLRYREIRRGVDCAAFSRCLTRRFLLPWVFVIYADQRHRLLACGCSYFVTHGWSARPQP